MSLTRAIGQKILDEIALRPFGDEAANAKTSVFPNVEVSIVSGRAASRRFTGRTSYYRKDGDGHPTHAVKLRNYESVVQLTVRAKGDSVEASHAECTSLLDDLANLFEDLEIRDELVQFIDPVSSTNQGVYRIHVDEQTAPRIDTGGEPKTHVGTLRIQVWHRGETAKPMTTYIQQVANAYP